MTEFTPVESLLGGLLIGISATLLMHGIGRIAGISGIVGGLFNRPSRDELGWRAAFLIGLLAASALTYPLAPSLSAIGANLPLNADIGAPAWLIVIAGLLVGYGTRMGAGCTSGHGVCGIGRLSPRSIVATCIFMGTAALTVFAHKLVLGA